MIRKLTIEPVLNGWIVKAGCQRIVFEETEMMLSAIRTYYSNPEQAEKQWTTGSLNAKHTMDGNPGLGSVDETPSTGFASTQVDDTAYQIDSGNFILKGQTND